MILKTLSLIAVLIVAAWLWLFFRGFPRETYDPDGELLVCVFVLLDAVVFLIGVVLSIAAIKHRALWWIAIAVFAVPLMHLLSCTTCNPLDMVLILFPIGVLPLIVVFKWKAILHASPGHVANRAEPAE